MIESWLIILLHQLVFQGMFVAKNIVLHRQTGKQIRGNNIEATTSIVFFAIFIGVALIISLLDQPFGEVLLLNGFVATVMGLTLLVLNLVISAVSLIHLKDSWRVGVLEDQTTELVSSGIYRFTRNPYFVSYFLMFAAYTVILQNIVLLGLSGLGFLLVHRMVKKEEEYLHSVHGDAYLRYKNSVPRYIFI